MLKILILLIISNRTKYELECFERGNALYERERLNVE